MNIENQKMSLAAYVRWTRKEFGAELEGKYREGAAFPKAPVAKTTAPEAPTFVEQVRQMSPDVMLMAGFGRHR